MRNFLVIMSALILAVVGLLSIPVSAAKVASAKSAVVRSIAVQAPVPQAQQPPQDGKTFCHNYDDEKNKIKKDCDCYRPCVNGAPGRDSKCVNHCFEDKCQCRNQCSS